MYFCEEKVRRGETEYNKKIKILQFANNTVPNLKQYYSSMLKVLEFETSDDGAFLVFGAPNTKCLTFGILDTSAFS